MLIKVAQGEDIRSGDAVATNAKGELILADRAEAQRRRDEAVAEEDRCDRCRRKDVPVYRPPHDDGTYPGECGRCLLKERDKLKRALERVVHEMNVAKDVLEGIR